MDGILTGFMSAFGYFGMFLGMILEAVIIIIPSELILATGGIFAAHGTFTFFGAFITGLLGSVFCAILIYVMGYFGGRSFVQKYGKYFFMKKEDIEKSDDWFEKYGIKAALIGRNFPIIRTFISLPLGIAKINFKKFVLYTTIGSIPWTLAFVTAGFYLGENWTIVSDIVNKFKIPIIIFFVLLVIAFFLKKTIKKKVVIFKFSKKY